VLAMNTAAFVLALSAGPLQGDWTSAEACALLRTVIKNHAAADATHAGTHDLAGSRYEKGQRSMLAG